MISYHLIKVLVLTAISFACAIAATPLLSQLLLKFKVGKNIRNDGSTPVYSALHAAKQGTPTMAGVLIWGTVTFLICLFWVLDRVFGIEYFHILNFLTRKETLLPLGALVGASLIGLADDILDLLGRGHNKRGFRFRHKLLFYALVAAIGAYWFYFKLGFNFLAVPFVGNIHVGLWYIPFFILVVIGTSFSVNQTDGLDGLAGGTLLISLLSVLLPAHYWRFYGLTFFLPDFLWATLAQWA